MLVLQQRGKKTSLLCGATKNFWLTRAISQNATIYNKIFETISPFLEEFGGFSLFWEYLEDLKTQNYKLCIKVITTF